MRTFKLLAGLHVDEQGTIRKKGELVSSYRDLVTQFKGKFEEVSIPIQAGPIEDAAPSGPSPSPEPKRGRRQKTRPRSAPSPSSPALKFDDEDEEADG